MIGVNVYSTSLYHILHIIVISHYVVNILNGRDILLFVLLVTPVYCGKEKFVLFI